MNSKSTDDLLGMSSDVHFSGRYIDEQKNTQTDGDQAINLSIDHNHRQPFLIGSLLLIKHIMSVFGLQTCLSCAVYSADT